MNLVETQHPAVVLTDLVLPEMDGLTLLQQLKETGRPPIVLMVTGHGTVESAVEAMRHGAFDYLTKPLDATRLQVLLEKSIEQESLSREVSFLRHQLRQKGSFGQMVGQSRGMQEVYRWIELAGTSTAPVLIYGESGTGKELVARTVHELSNRRNKPFVAINCAAIPETLIESELFGHERGAFTGRHRAAAGLLRAGRRRHAVPGRDRRDGLQHAGQAAAGAAGGDLPPGRRRQGRDPGRRASHRRHQPGAVRRHHGRASCARICSTGSTCSRSTCRRCAERAEDVPLLARTFIEEFNRQDNRQVRGLSSDAEKELERYRWPGNVRELRNVIQRAVVLSGTGMIGVEHLPDNVLRVGGPTPAAARWLGARPSARWSAT